MRCYYAFKKMAKKSMIARDVKRAKLVDKYAEKRAELKKRIAAGDMEAMFELNKLPKDSSVVRKRNRCQLDGRPRGYTAALRSAPACANHAARPHATQIGRASCRERV